MEEGKLYDKRIFESLTALDKLQFAVVKLKSCNGTQSVSFTDVFCGYEVLRDKAKRRPCFFPFTLMFKEGISFLKKIESARGGGVKNLESRMKDAVLRLNKFYETKEFNEFCLKRVFNMRMGEETTNIRKADVCNTLAEHLLGKLAPGESYTMNEKARGMGCMCGCQAISDFGPTGIGHEQVWHGFIDIVFSSNLGIPAIANTVLYLEEKSSKKRKIDAGDDIQSDDESADGKTECKQVTPEHVLTQAMAQTIVFSLVQKQRHPEFSDHVVPNIVISPEKVQIIMYDSDNDILLCSNPILLFSLDHPDNRTLIDETVVILWMVLHYRMFCSGFSEAKPYVLERCKSNFRQLVASKWDIYSKSLKDCVTDFPSVQKWPISELIQCGVTLEFDSNDF